MKGKLASSSSGLRAKLWNERYIFLLLLPGLIYFFTFKIFPIFGNLIAFQEFNPFKSFWESEWVGFANFQRIFEDAEVLKVMRNTIYISLMQIIFVFPAPILLAVMLNEVARERKASYPIYYIFTSFLLMGRNY